MQSKWGLKTQNTKNTKGDVKINFTCQLAWAQKRLISYIQVCLWGCFPNTLIWTRRLDKDLSSPLLLGIGSQSTKDPRRIKKVKNKFVLCDFAGISIVFLPLDIRALGSWAFRLRHTPSALRLSDSNRSTSPALPDAQVTSMLQFENHYSKDQNFSLSSPLFRIFTYSNLVHSPPTRRCLW